MDQKHKSENPKGILDFFFLAMSKKLNPNAPAFKFNPDAAPFVPFSQQPPTIPIQHDPKPEKKEIQAPKPQFVKRELKKQSKQEEKQPKQEEKEAKQEKRQELDQSQTNQEKPETTPEQKIEGFSPQQFIPMITPLLLSYFAIIFENLLPYFIFLVKDDDDDLEEAMRNVSLQAGETKLESEEDKDSEEIPSKVEEEDEFDDIEPSASVDQYKDIDAREHINVVFIGHVGKPIYLARESN